VTVIGFGATSENGPLSFNLLETTSQVVPFDDCFNFYGLIVDETQICMGNDDMQDACQGTVQRK